jgi:mannose-6-phosphate isomerase class I
MKESTYDKFPTLAVPQSGDTCVEGWTECAALLERAIAKRSARKTLLVIECYPGVDDSNILRQLKRYLKPSLILDAREALLPPDRIDVVAKPFLGGDDPVFGFLCGLTLPEFFDAERVDHMRRKANKLSEGLVLVIGCGANFITTGDILVYADLSRWEAQNRFRRNEASNFGLENRITKASLQYKRAFFVDWRVADRWKRSLILRWDFVLDTHIPNKPKLADGEVVRRGLSHAVTRPFRVVPFFDPAPWGGQWMNAVCDLPGTAPNHGWCFDCVPEENSLLLDLGGVRVEIPSVNLVFAQPRKLLGEAVHARFGDEFPIRFDFLDTMQGGNLSLQVHPLTEYIQHHFGMHYTQDESYYLLDGGPDACVYLGLKEGVSAREMARDLEAAQSGGFPFPAERYVNKFPARKHDHFLIPAGTVHCSGANSMILEISATPYIFTFKMWDWERLGLDGEPRPINLNHGLANIQWDQDTKWVKEQLINRIQPVASGSDWREERTGLHTRQFIETRRHWFTGKVMHDTHGGVNVLNLVEGDEVLVESPDHLFEPFPVHYAETFIVPAHVGAYSIRPSGSCRACATIKAFVR